MASNAPKVAAQVGSGALPATLEVAGSAQLTAGCATMNLRRTWARLLQPTSA
jgi:hypothetical protein